MKKKAAPKRTATTRLTSQLEKTFATSAAHPQSVTQFGLAERAAKFVLGKTKLRPQVALVLGSGLGDFADSLENSVRIPFAKIPGFPHASAFGHAGNLVVGLSNGVPVAALQGRFHYYEGHPLADVVLPTRVFARMGVSSVIYTNAAGGINANYKQGCLVLITDHISQLSGNPMIGPNEEQLGPRFFDMQDAYAKAYRMIALEEGRRLGIELFQGVYCIVSGPSYETPAEIRFLRTIGADLVGMSTVPEVIAARHLGLKVLGISCVTNLAAGTTDQILSHEEVLEVGRQVRGDFIRLLEAVILRIGSS